MFLELRTKLSTLQNKKEMIEIKTMDRFKYITHTGNITVYTRYQQNLPSKYTVFEINEAIRSPLLDF